MTLKDHSRTRWGATAEACARAVHMATEEAAALVRQADTATEAADRWELLERAVGWMARAERLANLGEQAARRAAAAEPRWCSCGLTVLREHEDVRMLHGRWHRSPTVRDTNGALLGCQS